MDRERNSLLPWYGPTPDGWLPSPLRHHLVRNDGGVWGEDAAEDGTIVLRSTEVALDGSWQIESPALRRLTTAERKGARLVAGDLLVTKSSGSADHLGKTALVSHDVAAMGCAFSNFMQRLRVDADTDPRYVFYILNGPLGRETLNYFGQTTTGLRNLSASILGSLVLPGAPLSAQHAIADFLDRKTQAIDELIRKKERLFELLQEKRQALITQAVTKGLDPSVPMKDSGVPWLGEIPAHWTVSQPKHLCSLIIDGPHVKPEYVDEGVPFVTVKNLTDGPSIDFTDLNYIDHSLHAQLTRRGRPERGDVLLTKDGTLGVPRVVETDKVFSFFVSVALLKPRRRLVDSYFLRYALEADSTWQQFQSGQAGSALKHIVLGTIGNVKLARPPRTEQQAIGRRVSRLDREADATLRLVRRHIALLAEYRQALISAAVTGQIDINQTLPAAAAVGT